MTLLAGCVVGVLQLLIHISICRGVQLCLLVLPFGLLVWILWAQWYLVLQDQPCLDLVYVLSKPVGLLSVIGGDANLAFGCDLGNGAVAVAFNILVIWRVGRVFDSHPFSDPWFLTFQFQDPFLYFGLLLVYLIRLEAQVL